MDEGFAVRQFDIGERHGEGLESGLLSPGVRVSFIIGAGALCWLAIFAAGYVAL